MLVLIPKVLKVLTETKITFHHVESPKDTRLTQLSAGNWDCANIGLFITGIATSHYSLINAILPKSLGCKPRCCLASIEANQCEAD